MRCRAARVTEAELVTFEQIDFFAGALQEIGGRKPGDSASDHNHVASAGFFQMWVMFNSLAVPGSGTHSSILPSMSRRSRRPSLCLFRQSGRKQTARHRDVAQT